MTKHSKTTIHTSAGESDILGDLTTLTKGAGVTFAGTVVGKALIFIYTIFLTRLIGSSDFGLYTLGVMVVLYLASIADLCLGVASTRFIAISESLHDKGRSKGIVIVAGLLTFLTILKGKGL